MKRPITILHSISSKGYQEWYDAGARIQWTHLRSIRVQLGERFSPLGRREPNFEKYGKGMRKAWDLHLVRALLRLELGDVNTEGAARQWL